MSGQLKLSKVFRIDPQSIHQTHKTLRNRDNAWRGLDRPTNRKLHQEMPQLSLGKKGYKYDLPIIDTIQLPLLSLRATDEQRWERWDILKEDMLKYGFDENQPILIHLDSDNIVDGNHRLAIAIELKLDYVAVQFQYLNCN